MEVDGKVSPYLRIANEKGYQRKQCELVFLNDKPKDEKSNVYHQKNRECQPQTGLNRMGNRLDMRAVSGKKQQAYEEDVDR